jgi:hypothetical protein
MKEGPLTRYMEAGFPHLKRMSRLPGWLVPDVTEVARELGDQAMLKLAKPLGLSDRLGAFLAQAPEADSLPSDIWQQSIASWQPVRQVLPVTMALLRACEKVDALKRRGMLKIDSSLVRSLAVISYAPFAPDGGEMLGRLASVLGGSADEPAGLLDLYTVAVVGGGNDTLTGVDHCILEDPEWAEWSRRFLATGKGFPFTPRVIGISPPLSSGLMQVLVSMIMEVLNADSSRNYPN